VKSVAETEDVERRRGGGTLSKEIGKDEGTLVRDNKQRQHWAGTEIKRNFKVCTQCLLVFSFFNGYVKGLSVIPM